MPPVLMPNSKSLVFFEGVTETVVPGQTRTSPPLDNRNTAVSPPAVKDDPAANCLPAITTSPSPLVTGTTAGVATGASGSTCGGWRGDVLLAAVRASAGFRRTLTVSPQTSPG